MLQGCFTIVVSITLKLWLYQVVESADQIAPGEEHLKITAREDFLLRAAAVNNNAGIALDYFCERV